MSTFTNPWLNLEPSNRKRTSLILDERVVARLHSVYSKNGMVQTTIAILLTKLADTLTSHGIVSYDPDAFEHGVANCEIKLKLPKANGQRPTKRPNRSTTPQS